MQPILNFIDSLVEKYIVHIPDEQKEKFRTDALEAAKILAEAGARGAVEGIKNG